MGKHPSRFYICLESKQQHKLRGHWASPALLCPHRNRPLVCTAKAGPVHLSLCSQPAQVHCKAARQVLQCPHFSTRENFIFLSGLALEMRNHISPSHFRTRACLFICLILSILPRNKISKVSAHPAKHQWAAQLKPALPSLSQSRRRTEPMAFSSSRAVCVVLLGFFMH